MCWGIFLLTFSASLPDESYGVIVNLRKLPILTQLLDFLHAMARGIRRVLFWRPFGHAYVGGDPDTPRAKFVRLCWEVAYRVAVLPLLLAGFYLVLVLGLTHPTRQLAMTPPEAYGLSSEQVSLVTADGVHLEAWHVSGLRASDVLDGQRWTQARPAVVCSHDYGASRDQLLSPLTVELTEMGYDVLLLDFRGHGQSGDAPVSFGQTETADVAAAVSYLAQRTDIDVERIGLYGRGMGGYASLLAAARLPGIRCVVAEGAYPSIDAHFRRTLGRTYLPKVIGDALGVGLNFYFGRRLSSDTAVEAVDRMGATPVLLLAGADDDRTPLADMGPVFRAGGDHVTGMLVAGGDNGRILTDDAAMTVIRNFFLMHLGQGMDASSGSASLAPANP